MSDKTECNPVMRSVIGLGNRNPQIRDNEMKIKSDMPCAKVAKEDSVNHPPHYNIGIETVDYIDSWNMGFNEGNVIKYVSRHKYKGKPLEDLKKARFYLDRLIAAYKIDNDEKSR